MKVTVNVCYSGAKVSGDGGQVRLSLAVKGSDTVSRLKQRVMLVEPMPFPDQVLLLDGVALEESQRIEDLSLKEGQELRFQVTATIAAFTQQLVDLLKARFGARHSPRWPSRVGPCCTATNVAGALARVTVVPMPRLAPLVGTLDILGDMMDTL
eukprot:Skav200377  [mRNA]  locus=scaffold2518:370861:374207:- [translate_table: standard]